MLQNVTGQGLPPTLVLEGPSALKLLAHEARQRVITEVYDGRELTATEAAELCGLTPSAMSYHLRMLERAGVLVLAPGSGDGRERRYGPAARSLEVRGAREGSRVHLQATVSIWLDSLGAAVSRWVAADSPGSGGMHTESLRLTEEENAELLERIRTIFREYADRSDEHGPDVARWETYWAHLPRVDEP
jgi:DNA-binding transcriptional ArsR family regulator